MKSKIFLIIIFALCMISTNAQAKSELKIDFLKSVPKEIDGCSGLYTYESTSLKCEKYIFASDLQETAFIAIGGKQIKLKKSEEKELAANSFRYVYKGSGYTLILISKTVSQIGDEVNRVKGTLEIRKGASKTIIKIKGDEGC